MVLPARASEVTSGGVADVVLVNWMDYVSDISVDGENNLLTVKLPQHWIFYKVMEQSKELEVGYGNYFTCVANKFSTLFIYPFGGAIGPDGNVHTGRLLDTSNLPDEYSIDIDIEVKFSGNDFSVDDHGYYELRQWAYNYEGDTLVCSAGRAGGTTLTSSPLHMEFWYDPHELATAPDAIGWDIQLNTLGGSNGSENYELSVIYSASLTMSISAAYYEFLQGNENSAVLNEIQKQLEEQNMTLDQILDALWSSSDGASGELVDQVGDQADQLGGITDVMDSVNRPDVGDIDVSIDQYITDEMMTSSTPLLSIILECPIVMQMLMLMLCMAFVGYVLFGKRG